MEDLCLLLSLLWYRFLTRCETSLPANVSVMVLCCIHPAGGGAGGDGGSDDVREEAV